VAGLAFALSKRAYRIPTPEKPFLNFKTPSLCSYALSKVSFEIELVTKPLRKWWTSFPESSRTPLSSKRKALSEAAGAEEKQRRRDFRGMEWRRDLTCKLSVNIRKAAQHKGHVQLVVNLFKDDY
jgi:hypothetical protein